MVNVAGLGLNGVDPGPDESVPFRLLEHVPGVVFSPSARNGSVRTRQCMERRDDHEDGAWENEPVTKPGSTDDQVVSGLVSVP